MINIKAFLILSILTFNKVSSNTLREKFEEKFKNKETYLKNDLKDFIYKFLLLKVNEQKEMILNVTEDYLNENLNKELSENEKKLLLDENKILNYFESWNSKMFDKLLDYFGIDSEDQFREEMKSNPLKYGLNYEAYQIIQQ